jgi:hypothetical protein
MLVHRNQQAQFTTKRAQQALLRAGMQKDLQPLPNTGKKKQPMGLPAQQLLHVNLSPKLSAQVWKQSAMTTAAVAEHVKEEEISRAATQQLLHVLLRQQWDDNGARTALTGCLRVVW